MQRGQFISRHTDGRRGSRPVTRLLIAGLLIAQAATTTIGAAATAQTMRPDALLAPTSVADGSTSIPAFVRLPRQDANQADAPFGNDARTALPREQYLPYILAGAAAILLQGLLLNWLLRERDQRRRPEAEAHETMLQLAHLNRIATAGGLSASIAHELTQPITGMVASANAALRWLADPAPQIDRARSALTQVVSAGERTKEIIHGVRAMFKSEAEDRRAIDMNEVIVDVLALVEGDLKRHDIEVETDLGRSSVPVLGEYIQLQQLVLNLTVNAIESMSGIESRPRTLHLHTAYRNGKVAVSIADVGVGIRASDINAIFKPLYTTKPQGMGMGLSICRSIVEAHKGRISVSRGEQHGAVFHIVLPTGG